MILSALIFSLTIKFFKSNLFRNTNGLSDDKVLWLTKNENGS